MQIVVVKQWSPLLGNPVNHVKLTLEINKGREKWSNWESMKRQITKTECAKKHKNYFECHKDILSQRCNQQSDLGGSGKTGLDRASTGSWTAVIHGSILSGWKSSCLHDSLLFSPTFINVSLKFKLKIQKKKRKSRWGKKRSAWTRKA